MSEENYKKINMYLGVVESALIDIAMNTGQEAKVKAYLGDDQGLDFLGKSSTEGF